MAAALWRLVLPQPTSEPKTSYPLSVKRVATGSSGHTVPWLCTNYTTIYQQCHLYAKWAILFGHTGPIGVIFTGLIVYQKTAGSFVFFVYLHICANVRIFAFRPVNNVRNKVNF